VAGGVGWGAVPVQQLIFCDKLLDRERSVHWGIVVIEEPIVEPKYKHFCTAKFLVTSSTFLDNKPGHPSLSEKKQDTALLQYFHRICTFSDYRFLQYLPRLGPL
jgi:hypothetical protein